MAVSNQSQEAYAELRRKILILEILPDERLKEEEWAERLHFGRLAVREALTRLQGEGLVTRGKKGGFFTATMTPADVRDIREVREMLETTAVRLAKPRITQEQIKELESACDDFAFMVKKGYHTGACEADRHFHQLLVASSGNRKLIRAYEQSHIPLFHIRLGQSREYMDDYADTEREHRQIAAALKTGRTEQAVELLRAHFTRGESAALSHVRSE